MSNATHLNSVGIYRLYHALQTFSLDHTLHKTCPMVSFLSLSTSDSSTSHVIVPSSHYIISYIVHITPHPHITLHFRSYFHGTPLPHHVTFTAVLFKLHRALITFTIAIPYHISPRPHRNTFNAD